MGLKVTNNAFGTQIPGSKDAMVELAFEQGWVITAVQRQVEHEASLNVV